MIVIEKAGKLWIRIRTWIPFLLFQKGSMSYTRRWLRSVLSRHDPLEDAIPWFHFFAIDWLTSYVQPSMKVFEWGSGGSTLFWTRHVEHVIAVEHDQVWYERVLHALEETQTTNATLLHIPSDKKTADTPDDQPFVDKDIPEVFKEYANRINAYQDAAFDIIVVDGLVRLACLKNAIPKIRPGGVIVFDNSNWFEEGLTWFDADNWSILHFRGPGPYEPTGSFTVTTLIIKKTPDVLTNSRVP